MTDYAPSEPLELILSRTKRLGSCLIWQGTINASGYARTYFEGRSYLAHRLVYEMTSGPIPHGMTIDHLCFQTACVNPNHLRVLSPGENARRQRSAFKTHCKQGHEFTPENTYIRPEGREGRRQCRACNLAAQHRYKARMGDIA